jgi:chromosome segregation ATPase
VSWITNFWKALETVATLSKEVDRATENINELRRDVNTLTLTLSQLRSDFTHEKATNKLILDNFEKDGRHLKESIDVRFDVLLTRLDARLAAFENRKRGDQSETKNRSLVDD